MQASRLLTGSLALSLHTGGAKSHLSYRAKYSHPLLHLFVRSVENIPQLHELSGGERLCAAVKVLQGDALLLAYELIYRAK